MVPLTLGSASSSLVGSSGCQSRSLAAHEPPDTRPSEILKVPGAGCLEMGVGTNHLFLGHSGFLAMSSSVTWGTGAAGWSVPLSSSWRPQSPLLSLCQDAF